MATPCTIKYKGQTYSYSEWQEALHNGLIAELSKAGVIDIPALKPFESGLANEKVQEPKNISENDTENKSGVSSEIGIGEKPIETELDKGASTSEIGSDRNVQAHEKVVLDVENWSKDVESTAKALESKKEEELNKILPERERLSHRIVKDEYTTTADDMTKGGNLIPNDFYQHPEYYADLSDPNYKESWDAIKKIKGNPDAEITIYRSAPNGSAIEEGDWISLSKKYAKQEGEHPTDESQDFPVISMKVKAKEIVWDGNDINEFAYYPEKSESKADKISKAYHKAKADGSNPELVKAVEDLLGNPKEAAPQAVEVAEPLKDVESTAKALESIDKESGKNLISGFLNEFTGKDYFYHGTTKDFTRFKKTTKAGVEDIETEQPIFLAQDKNAAEPFSNSKGGRLLRVKLSPTAKIFNPDAIIKSGSYIEYDYSNLTDEAKELAEALDNGEIELTLGKLKDKDGYEILSQYIQYGDWDVLESKGIKEWLISKGYDGVFIREFRNTPDKNLAIFNTDKLIINNPKSISEAYHKAKADGSNPELVKAVEDLLGNPKEQITNEREAGTDTSTNAGVRSSVGEVLQQGESGSVSESANVGRSKKETKVEQPKAESDFSRMAKSIPKLDVVKKYESGKTILKNTGEFPENEQEYIKQILREDYLHGIDTIEQAKIDFGDNYVNKVLDFIEKEKLSEQEKALLYVSLENDILQQQKENPSKRSELQRKLNAVRVESQRQGRSASLVLNYRRILAAAKYNFVVEDTLDNLFTTTDKENKKSVEEAIEASADKINDAYEERLANLEKEIEKGVEAKLNEIYEALPKARKVRAEKAIKALDEFQKKLRDGKFYDASIGVPIAILDAGITLAKNLIKKGDDIYDAVEAGIKKIKELHRGKFEQEDDFRKGLTQALEKEGLSKKKLSQQQQLKQLLIEAGFSRTTTIKGEKREILDWKKLAGREKSVKFLKENVEQVLKAKGVSATEIAEEIESLEKEFNDLRISIVEKSINELRKKSKDAPEINIRSISKRLVELYDFGLFEESNINEYNASLNKVLGFSEFKQGEFERLQKLANGLSVLFSQKSDYNNGYISENFLKPVSNLLNHQIKLIVTSAGTKEAPLKFKAVSLFNDITSFTQRLKLMSLKQIITNTTSGDVERKIMELGSKLNKELQPKERKKLIKDLGWIVFNDIRKNASLTYGETTSALTNRNRFEDWINSQTDNQLIHMAISAVYFRTFLEAADSYNKAIITENIFAKNIVELLTNKGLGKDAMSVSQAWQFVNEQTTGQKFEDALKKAEDIIRKVNKESDVVKLNKENTFRLAMDIVKENLFNNSALTEKMVESSYRAGEKSAGFNIGHEANNFISAFVKTQNVSIQKKLEKAIKEKKWKEATNLMLLHVLVNNFLNVFVGGGMNWAFLEMEKLGIPWYLLDASAKAKDNPIDLESEQGMRNLTNSLIRKQNLINAQRRQMIGATVQIVSLMALFGSGKDDDLAKWLKENPYFKKYINVFPTAISLAVATENGELKKQLLQIANVTNADFSLLSDIEKAKEMNEYLGVGGKMVGSAFETPIPTRFIKDVHNIVRALKGLEPITTNYKVDGFFNGLLMGGFVDYVGLRPYEDYEMSDALKKLKKEDNEYKAEVDDIYEKRESGEINEAKALEMMNEKFPAGNKEQDKLRQKAKKYLFDRQTRDIAKRISDPFYYKFYKEQSQEAKAVMFHTHFGNYDLLSEKQRNEIEKNMNAIGFKPSENDVFRAKYAELLNSKEKPND